MIILDPDPSTDAVLTRSSSAYYWDAAGVLRQEAPNRLRITYDPADLTAPPYALVEPYGVNLLSYSYTLADFWTAMRLTPEWESSVTAPTQTEVDKLTASADLDSHYVEQSVSGAYIDGAWYTLWMIFKAAEFTQVRLQMSDAASGYADFDLAAGSVLATDAQAAVRSLGGGWYRCSVSAQVTNENATALTARATLLEAGSPTFAGDGIKRLLWCGAQMEPAAKPTSYIPSTFGPTVREADVLGSGTFVRSSIIENDAVPYDATAGYVVNEYVLDPVNHLVYASNKGSSSAVTLSVAAACVVTWVGHALPANTPFRLSTTGETPAIDTTQVYYVRAPAADSFTFSLTPGGAAVASSGTQSGVHTITAGNVGNALTNTEFWRQVGASNARKMVDQYNNTQSTANEEIIVVLRALSISQGLYLGNMEGVTVSVTAVDPDKGLVYSETHNQTVSDSGSSFFNWHFKRIRRKNYFFTALLPVYAKALVTVRIRNPGAVAKCGVCVLGPLIDIGLSQYGLSTEIKDYSTTKFNVDGTSETLERGYSRRMTLDVLIPNSKRDAIEDNLISFKQKNVLYVGSYLYGSAIVYGKYASFKNMLENFSNSKCTLQINGTV